MIIDKNFLIFFWGVIVTGIILSLTSDPAKTLLSDSVNFALALFFTTLAGLFCFDRFKKLNRQELEHEYKLIKKTKDLKPKDLNFKELEPRETLKDSERPYFKIYINREATPYEASEAKKIFYTENDLAELLKQGSNILLIGNPTEGKTRTVFEVIKRLSDFLVISLPINSSLSDKALQLLKKKKLIWLFDDLNTHDNDNYDFNHNLNRIKEITSLCVLIATCRDGPEFKYVNLNFGQLHKIYESFDHKLILKPVSEDQKEMLKSAIGETASRAFPTLGSICMHKHFEFMQNRFSALGPLEKDCLHSILLLHTAYIAPLTQFRIKAVLNNIFKRLQGEAEIRDCLNTLIENGFIISQKDIDPIIPEAAYVTNPESKHYYPNGRNLLCDMRSLAVIFTSHKDVRGLNNLAVSLYYLEDKESAMKVWQQILDTLKNPQEFSLKIELANTLLNKGYALGLDGKSITEVICYDEVIKRFEASEELGLREAVAQAFINKGLSFVNPGKSNQEIDNITYKFKDATDCYDEILRRFGENTELTLQERVARALVLKGLTLAIVRRLFNSGTTDQVTTTKQLDKILECFDEVEKRFGKKTELVLRTQVARALVNKGYELLKDNKSEDSIVCNNKVLMCFRESREFPLQEQVIRALVHKGLALMQLGNFEKAIKYNEKIIKNFGERVELSLQDGVAKAFLNKCIALRQVGRIEDAVSCENEAIKRFGKNPQLILLEESFIPIRECK
ncbi:MAG: tetratricopeptide repeat protein [Nitrosomonas sp.]